MPLHIGGYTRADVIHAAINGVETHLAGQPQRLLTGSCSRLCVVTWTHRCCHLQQECFHCCCFCCRPWQTWSSSAPRRRSPLHPSSALRLALQPRSADFSNPIVTLGPLSHMQLPIPRPNCHGLRPAPNNHISCTSTHLDPKCNTPPAPTHASLAPCDLTKQFRHHILP